MYNKLNYIYWSKEARKIKLTQDEMREKLRNVLDTRKQASSKTKRAEFDELTCKIDRHGDYYEIYMYEDGEYRIYSSNARDDTKNIDDNCEMPERLFDNKFKELNGLSLRRAFGFVNKIIKRNIPKQFDYINEKYLEKLVKASSIDASSQYPSGCYGILPDAHHFIKLSGRHAPTAEYPFAYYKSGHLAIYNELDTHDWLTNKLFNKLFRLSSREDYHYLPLTDDEEETILCKASEYTMNSTWDYFYNKKQSCEKGTVEYNQAKLVMNKTIGCWHLKDKDRKRIRTYDDHGSYQLAHIVAVCIARGNQKILNKIDELGLQRVLHVCVDGIIYLGDDVRGINESKIGVFAQEFTGADFLMKNINVYAAEQNGIPIKFKHSGFDLIYDKEFESEKIYSINDLNYLGTKIKLGDIINGTN